MAHRLIQLGLLLLLVGAGAIVNIAVAWALSTMPIRPTGTLVVATDSDVQPFRDAGWQNSDRTWQGYGLFKYLATSVGAEWHDCFEATGLEPLPPHVRILGQSSRVNQVGISVRAGWPARAMFGCMLYQRWDDDGVLLSHDVPHGVFLSSSHSAMLPARPIWPGFAINTPFYAAVLWLLFAAPFALRRRRRIKRGLCSKCAYPVGMGASPVCTECGKPLIKQKAQTQKAETT